MAVCKFYMQGRCQFGQDCRNEHPRGGRGCRGDAGHRNKVSVNPSQQKGGFSQQGSSRVSNQCGGRGHRLKSAEISVSSQNNNRRDHEQGQRGGEGEKGRERRPAPGEEDEKQKLEIIQTQSDMMVWESSGQSGFSCSSGSKAPFFGLDISPEEQRSEYYATKSYLDSITWLLIQWGDRMNPSTCAALLVELRNPAPQALSSGFGSAPTGCGSSSPDVGNRGFDGEPPAQATKLSVASPASGLGSPVAPTSPPGAVEISGDLLSLESELTQGELDQLKAQRFTLGLVPLKQTPAAMLAI
ncbi:nucleoporin NUP42-like isoform X2 [Nerophis lumbriciformis]|uniref:nucleoporin NUP42-like isoform X2 n=1 Tax=Nerophis lumbriciformis TaxID=546530 RepID=UPI002ADF2A6D|nr:nucleoporin NUP42-like isoform X2 [Nerophis lumbriciformis]